MSFSNDVKTELIRQYAKSRHCQLAELAGMLALEGRVTDGLLIFDTENTGLQEKYRILIKKAFALNAETVLERGESMRILSTLKWKADGTTGTVEGLLVQQTCCKRAFIRGAFLAAGSISDPEKSYHFEIVCRTMAQAGQLQGLMRDFEAEARIVERKGHYVVYLKEGSQIVDMLNVMEAYVSLMNLENVRILKEMRNSVNRKVNCETANINKTVGAAVRQIEDIRRIQAVRGLDSLPEPLREVAQLRLEYPEATLVELGAYLDPPVGKSGVNHRLHRISELADEL
ncbi:MAG: DNA-binding protein WhiA [Agathobacter sp.]|nr:DNA-binding protein WhiA [Agathobacter sp.]